MNKIIVEVSIGELFDKISILEIKQEKIKFTEIKMKNQKLTLYFSTAKECTMFGLKYDREKQKEIFRTSKWS